MMRLLRIALALVVVVEALSSLFPLLGQVAFKLRLIHPASGPAAHMVPLWQATPAWQLAVWAACVAVLLLAAWRLIRRRPALLFYIAAVLTNAGLQWLMQRSPAYHRLFSAATLRFDYDRWAVLLLVGALIWWVEQQPAKPAG